LKDPPRRELQAPQGGLLEKLAALARWHRMAVFGVADMALARERLDFISPEIAAEFTFAFVMGYRLQRAVLETITDRPSIIYFHHYRQVNYQLDRAALAIAGAIEEEGYRALAIPASQYIGADPMRGHISHRVLGWAAGLGWIGRSRLLVHPEFGAHLRYVSVLTDAPLSPGEPLDRDCGNCRACIEVCPARAIGEKSSEFNLDACFARLKEFSRLPFIGQHICGICVKVCHPGRWP